MAGTPVRCGSYPCLRNSEPGGSPDICASTWRPEKTGVFRNLGDEEALTTKLTLDLRERAQYDPVQRAR